MRFESLLANGGIAEFDWCAKGHVGSHPFSILFSGEAANGLLARQLPGTYLDDGEGLRNAALLTHIAMPFINAAEDAGIAPLSFHAAQMLTGVALQDADRLTCAVIDNSGAKLGHLAMMVPADLARLIAEKLGKRAENSVHADAVTIQVSLVAGMARISSRELRRLSVGDGILPAHMPLNDNNLWVDWGGGALRIASLAGLTATLTSERVMRPPSGLPPFPESIPPGPFGLQSPPVAPNLPFAPGFMNPAAPRFEVAAQNTEPLVAADDVPVNITFEVARFEVPVSELSGIRVGSRFDLAQNPKNAVVVRANGVAVALGEIVQAGDRMAVRITSVKP
ncbi:MAG: hypothetical protein HC779_00305 [Phyllobacteriaceae bacterium]|nr:hypothetical protein [Phyllobacteriaceae bacterium]